MTSTIKFAKAIGAIGTTATVAGIYHYLAKADPTFIKICDKSDDTIEVYGVTNNVLGRSLLVHCEIITEFPDSAKEDIPKFIHWDDEMWFTETFLGRTDRWLAFKGCRSTQRSQLPIRSNHYAFSPIISEENCVVYFVPKEGSATEESLAEDLKKTPIRIVATWRDHWGIQRQLTSTL